MYSEVPESKESKLWPIFGWLLKFNNTLTKKLPNASLDIIEVLATVLFLVRVSIPCVVRDSSRKELQLPILLFQERNLTLQSNDIIINEFSNLWYAEFKSDADWQGVAGRTEQFIIVVNSAAVLRCYSDESEYKRQKGYTHAFNAQFGG